MNNARLTRFAAELFAVAEIEPTAVRIDSRVVVLMVLAVSIKLT